MGHLADTLTRMTSATQHLLKAPSLAKLKDIESGLFALQFWVPNLRELMTEDGAPGYTREQLVAVVVERADHVVAACAKLAQDANLCSVDHVEANVHSLCFWLDKLRDRVNKDPE
jgi:hypothetical protein